MVDAKFATFIFLKEKGILTMRMKPETKRAVTTYIVAFLISFVTSTCVNILFDTISPKVSVVEEPVATAAPISTPEPTPEIIPTEEPTPEPEINQKDLELLACVIYQEAGGDTCCDECRRRVADVVLNRVESKRFPNTIHKVLTQKQQYGRFHQTGVVWPERANNPGEAEAVARAYRIAEEVLRGNHSSLYGNGYIWQASFPQGSANVYCCGTYFGK